MESKSESYRTKELEARIKELEAALGRASFDKMFYEKLIDMANQEFNTDIKKNFAGRSVSSTEKKGTGQDK